MSEIITKRLRLTPMTAGHVTNEYLSWLNDKELMRFSRQRHFSHSRESSLAYQRTFIDSPNFLWAVLDKENNDVLIGTLTAYVDTLAKVADVGILIAPRVKGKGYGSEAWGMVLSFLFEESHLRKVTAGTVRGNLGMEGIAAHWGMTLEGVLREQEWIDDKPCDILKYGLLKSEWKEMAMSTSLQQLQIQV